MRSLLLSYSILLFISCNQVGVLPSVGNSKGGSPPSRALPISSPPPNPPSTTPPALLAAVPCPVGYASVSDQAGLQAITNALGNNYCLTADIALSGAWTPLGNSKNPFTGNFHGGNHVIKDIQITDASKDYVGLFGKVTGEIRDIVIMNADVTGKDNVGALAGSSEGNLIDNVQIQESKVMGTNRIGGLIGVSIDSTILNSHSWADVTGSGNKVGGISGWASGLTLTNSVTSGRVSGVTSVGGLVGYMGAGKRVAEVKDSHAKSTVVGTEKVGGLIGQWEGSIIGVVRQVNSGSLWGSSAEGEITGTVAVGGLFGDLGSGDTVVLEKSHALVIVTGSGYGVGGLIGVASNDRIIESYMKGTINGGSSAGGLVGSFSNTVALAGPHIVRSYADGNITGTTYVGGLVGIAYSTSVEDSYLEGAVAGDSAVGGILGRNETDLFAGVASSLRNSYVNGLVRGISKVGGLIGDTSHNLTITATYYDQGATTLTTDLGKGSITGTRGLAVTKNDNLTESTVARGSKPQGYYDTVDGTVDPDDKGNDTQVFIGWDFLGAVWNWKGNGQWPKLR